MKKSHSLGKIKYGEAAIRKKMISQRKKPCRRKMKQLDVVVSPPAFVWDIDLTLTHLTFDLDPGTNTAFDL